MHEKFEILGGLDAVLRRSVWRGLEEIPYKGEQVFTILDAVGMSEQKHCLPVVTAMINPELGLPFDDIDFQHVIAQGRL